MEGKIVGSYDGSGVGCMEGKIVGLCDASRVGCMEGEVVGSQDGFDASSIGDGMRGPTESAVDKREGTVSSDGIEVGSALSLAVRGSVGFSDSIEVSVALVIEED